MNSRGRQNVRKGSEGGYALLVVMFLVTLLLISTMAVAPNILTEGRREQEKEMIWRGKQYTRGVKLYYRKLGRFPTSIDDLTKPKMGSIRFMRQAYKDPMNKEDGTWRLIYVGAAGQLIGSLKPPQQNLQLPQMGGAAGTPASALGGIGGALQPGTAGQAGSSFGQQTPFGQQTSFGQQNAGATQPGGMAAGSNAPGGGTNALGTSGTPAGTDQSDQQAIPSGDTPTIVGGNIIGVGGKINKSSIIIYDKAKNYRLFEFIWDPSKDNAMAAQQGMQSGQNPFGQQPSQFGQQPGQNPSNSQQPVQNPQNPPQNPQQP